MTLTQQQQPPQITEVWTVDENDWDKFPGSPIMVCSTKEEAIRRARILNKHNAFGCEIDDNGDYIVGSAFDNNPEENYLYYDVGSFNVDETFNEGEW